MTNTQLWIVALVAFLLLPPLGAVITWLGCLIYVLEFRKTS